LELGCQGDYRRVHWVNLSTVDKCLRKDYRIYTYNLYNASIRRRVTMEKQEYEVVWPRGKKAIGTIGFARRPETLEGKTVGELWDWVFRGDVMFPVIRTELAKRYPGVKFVDYEVFGTTHGADEKTKLAIISDKLKENRCDVVISGVGC
jgi:hypothetical protein